jgi:hypothetical protein
MSLTLPPLPYAIDALEPHVSRRTMATHYGRHHAAYVEKTRALLQRTAMENASLEEIVLSSAPGSTLFNVAAQAWNHAFLWHSMCPGGRSGAGHARRFDREELRRTHRFLPAVCNRRWRSVRKRVGMASTGRLTAEHCGNAKCRNAADCRFGTAADDRRLGACLLPRLSAPTSGLHRGFSCSSGQLGLRQP